MIRSNDKSRLWNKIVVYMAIFIFLLIPNRVEAAKNSEKPYFSCTYKLNGKDNNGIKSIPDINGKTITISLALDKKTIIKDLPNNINWNTLDGFDKKFLEEAKKEKCPTLGVKYLLDGGFAELYTRSVAGACEGHAALCEDFKGTGKLTGEKADAEERPYITCKYKVTKGSISSFLNLRGKEIQEFIFSLAMDKKTLIKDVEKDLNLFFEDNFDETLKKSLAEGMCPTIGVVVRNTEYWHIYPYSVGPIANSEKALGNFAEDIKPKNDGDLSEEAESSGATKVTYKTCTLNQKQFQFQEVSKTWTINFRISSTGVKQWSITERGSDVCVGDNKNQNECSSGWVDLKSGSEQDLFSAVIQLSNNSGNVRIAKDLFDYVFGNTEKLECDPNSVIYRNVDHMSVNGTNSTNYILSFGMIDMYKEWTENDAYLSYQNQQKALRKNKASLDGLNQSLTCKQIFSSENEGSVIWLLQKLLNYIRILGPFLVIILSAMDFIKAIAASDEEALKKAQGKLTIRLIAVVALFLVPLIVDLTLQIISGISDPTCMLK